MFYSEFIDDPKMKRFSVEEWGVWAGLLCLAAKSPTFGSLYIGKDLKYELSDICLALNNYDIEKLKVVLNKFQELKMMDYDENGAINIINFRERQSSEHPKMVYQRVKKFRNKQRNENETDLKQQDNGQIRLDKIRLDKNIDIVGNADKEWNFKNFLEGMDNHKRRDFQIMAAYWQFKEVKFTNKEQAYGEIKRLLRPAKDLMPYEDEKIAKTMKWLSKNADFKWTMETIVKYINEDLTKIKPKI